MVHVNTFFIIEKNAQKYYKYTCFINIDFARMYVSVINIHIAIPIIIKNKRPR